MKAHFRYFLKITIALALLMPVIACVNYKKVKLTSVSIGSVSPSGLKSVDGTVKIGIENNSCEFTIQDIQGTVYRSGTEIGTFTADDVTVATGSATYTVGGNLSINSNISIIEIISIAAKFKIDDFTMDLTLKVKPKGGAAVKVSRENIAVSDLINTLKTRGA